jgi:TDG/mug DNA glycosylase family protein
MSSLPDILAPSLHVVICGTAVGERSAERRRYYAGPGNDFWRLLHLSGLTPDNSIPTRTPPCPTTALA